MNYRLKTLELSGKWVSLFQAATVDTSVIHWRMSKEQATGIPKPAKELLCGKVRDDVILWRINKTHVCQGTSEWKRLFQINVYLSFLINYSCQLSVQIIRFLRSDAGLKSHSSLDIFSQLLKLLRNLYSENPLYSALKSRL